MDLEYTRLQQELHTNIDIRNKLLTFSFTAALAVLGIGLANFDSIFFLAYLIPFIIIIPCTSRIIYYKDLYAQKAAYLTVYNESSIKKPGKRKSVCPALLCRFLHPHILCADHHFLLKKP